MPSVVAGPLGLCQPRKGAAWGGPSPRYAIQHFNSDKSICPVHPTVKKVAGTYTHAHVHTHARTHTRTRTYSRAHTHTHSCTPTQIPGALVPPPPLQDPEFAAAVSEIPDTGSRGNWVRSNFLPLLNKLVAAVSHG